MSQYVSDAAKPVWARQQIQLLKDAKKRLLEGKNTMICIALGDAFRQYPREQQWQTSTALNGVLRAIQRSLKPHGIYQDWLENKHPHLYHSIHEIEPRFNKLKEARLAWIDWMIADIKQNGAYR